MLRAAMADPDEPRESDADEASVAARDEDAAAPTKKPKKKKSKKAAREAAKDAPRPIPGAGTAEGDKLREALRAFEVGDHVRVRARARDLESASDPAVREAAAELRARISIDPAAVIVMLACAAVLATIIYVWIL
jgi:hypothetical protein